MIIRSRQSNDLRYSQVTPKQQYLNRRRFLSAGSMALGALALPGATAEAGTKLQGVTNSKYTVSDKQTPYRDATTYNNFYEFGTDKGDPAEYAASLRTSPWTVQVDGDVAKPRKFDISEIMKLAPLEERIYRHRCVEAWSMVIPWIGIPLSALLKVVEPTAKAKYVSFQSLYDARQMPHARAIDFPYMEGLRLDEAMNPLTLLSVGMYGEVLPNQNGAPLRLTVPWKYGFKGIKSIRRIRLVGSMPSTSWNMLAPSEYGFYSNVNPHVDHPRWSQAKERRIGEFFKRDTLMFNGYGEQVASLYSGMDLKKNY